MEVLIFIGLQASGKSTFYKDRFFDSHIRINLDMLRTRNRERILVEACFVAKQPFVVDNTNPTAAERKPYIERAKTAGFKVVGYYFQSKLEECKARNLAREGKKKIPLPGILGTYGKLDLPTFVEGFDELYYVKICDGKFTVEKWQNDSQ